MGIVRTNVLEIASRIKAHGGLSVADSWIWATAIAYGATLVHKDPEFESSERFRRKSSNSQSAFISHALSED
jgi:predicted nucleic acid-binding protein